MELENLYIGCKLTVDDKEYLICEDLREVIKSVSEHCKETLWAFLPSFLAKHTNVSEKVIKSIQKHCEEGNEALLKLIDDWDDFVKDAIETDGAGHFLASHDDQEIDLDSVIKQNNLSKNDFQMIKKMLKKEGHFKKVSRNTPAFRIN